MGARYTIRRDATGGYVVACDGVTVCGAPTSGLAHKAARLHARDTRHDSDAQLVECWGEWRTFTIGTSWLWNRVRS